MLAQGVSVAKVRFGRLDRDEVNHTIRGESSCSKYAGQASNRASFTLPGAKSPPGERAHP